MAAYFTVYCDEPECWAQLQTAEDYDFSRAVEEAVRHGWVADKDDKHHYCPKHKRSASA